MQFIRKLTRHLSQVVDWVFAPQPSETLLALQSRSREQQTAIWALQAKLNSYARENRMLRAQLEDLHELAQFGGDAVRRHVDAVGPIAPRSR